MILRWRICFRCLWSLLWLAAGMAGATVSGQVSVVAQVDGAHHHADGSTTVVWLSPVQTSAADGSAQALPHARMIQKDKHFHPHVLAIQVGTYVDFPNEDPIFHNAFSNYDGQLFDIGLYPPGSSRSIRFRREGLVRVFCNIHPAMSAVIVVLATPYFTVTDAKGGFVLTDVPPGQYELHFFYEQATAETLDKLMQMVSIGAEDANLGLFKISEAGYIPTPHKNKFGRDYPADGPAIYH